MRYYNPRVLKVKKSCTQLQLRSYILESIRDQPQPDKITKVKITACFFRYFLARTASLAHDGVKRRTAIRTPLPLWPDQLLWNWTQLQPYSLIAGLQRLVAYSEDWNDFRWLWIGTERAKFIFSPVENFNECKKTLDTLFYILSESLSDSFLITFLYIYTEY